MAHTVFERLDELDDPRGVFDPYAFASARIEVLTGGVCGARLHTATQQCASIDIVSTRVSTLGYTYCLRR